MKVAFVGSHGVGKTALCYGLAAHLKKIDYSVGLVQEVARESPLPINRETTLNAQLWILHTQIAREIAAAERNRAVVCDRSVLDNYAYLVHQVGRRRDLDLMVAEWLTTYTLLVKVPIWQRPRYDGVRATDLRFQQEIDAGVDRLILELEPPCLRLDPKGKDGWVMHVLRHLRLPLEPPQVDLFPPGDGHDPEPESL
jgi:thymidylate kinase